MNCAQASNPTPAQPSTHPPHPSAPPPQHTSAQPSAQHTQPHTDSTAQHTQRTAHPTTPHTQHTAQTAQAAHPHRQRTHTANTAQPCLCLSVWLCVCVCGLCVRVLSYSDSKCFCVVFCAVFSVCVLFCVNFNSLVFQLFACLFAQRAIFMVTRCANCDFLCFVTDSPTHNPPTPTHETHPHTIPYNGNFINIHSQLLGLHRKPNLIYSKQIFDDFGDAAFDKKRMRRNARR
jgi:hypothetical protein